MAAIISDKFRIFNAKQFLESLTEGATDTSAERSRMYFFVGRPQPWRAYLEVYSKNATSFTVGDEVYVGTYGSTAFRATIAAVYDSALLLTDVFGSNGVNSAPALGSALKCRTGGAGGSDTGATAVSGVYRYADENIPPLPLDNQREKIALYDELIAAKRITDSYARTVIRRYNWDLVANPRFDMWKPDYSDTPGGGGQIGKAGATGATSIADAKFYVMNSQYEVFKCLYNGENPSNTTGQDATEEPTVAGANYDAATGLYTETTGAGYIWKHMYTIPTDDVLKFLSSDFMPIVLPSNPSRQSVEALAVAGAIDTVVVEDAGAGLPVSQTLYTAIKGDGTGGVVELVTNGSGTITSASIQSRGSGYTYGNILLGVGNLFSDTGLTTSVGGYSGNAAIEAILPPQGGHGSDHEEELNGKRVMTNIRLTYAEGSGDFPVDNDFRRIGIIADPYNQGTTTFATADTLSGLKSLKITGATADFNVDEKIVQTVTGGTAYGTVVSWTLDSGSTTAGVLKYIQTNDAHTDQGVVRAFESNGANAVTGETSAASGTVDTGYAGSLLGVTFTAGLANTEIENNSGDVIYIENRRLITRAPDQIEDIKLVIEF
jgi:hypothetical protein